MSAFSRSASVFSKIPVCALSVLAGSLLLLAGCSTSAINTLPPLTPSEEPTQRYTLYVPDSLEVQSVDFDVALYSDAEEGETTAADEIGGRSFIEVYAVHRSTGEQYLLLYENVRRRARPIVVLRFEPQSNMPSIR